MLVSRLIERVKDYISNYDGDDYQIYGKIDLALEKIGRELDVETRKIGMIDKRLWNVVHIGINEMYEEGLIYQIAIYVRGEKFMRADYYNWHNRLASLVLMNNSKKRIGIL